MLQANRRTLKDFKPIPFPKNFVTSQLGNQLILEELNYDKQQLHDEFIQLYSSLTDEQKSIFKKITSALKSKQGGVFFLNGYGGTGKTFMYRTLAAAIRSKGDIVLTVASSGIASLLLPGGRTAHSKFKIPVPTLDNSTCNINGDSDHAELLRQTKLIIWDEAPMCHRYTFECLDRSLKDLMTEKNNSPKLFGGKVVVFGGDFRQILPVIPRGRRSDIVHSAINASHIWDYCQVLTLTKNMRLQNKAAEANAQETHDFAKWILKVGEGKISEPNDGHADITIPDELLIPMSDNPIKSIVESTYPTLLQNYKDVNYLESRAILASTIETVDEINNYVLGLIPGEEREYLSSNSVDRTSKSCTQVENWNTNHVNEKLGSIGRTV
ncbi:helicase-like protein [Trifolium medium]|uniref:ATP-dependent DNA helicase n=1 Tax=Trifolium medium TaxID=97028 RepID=A0A392ME89_9FABA|nr:helicase-like protein [Trifolium medium]